MSTKFIRQVRFLWAYYRRSLPHWPHNRRFDRYALNADKCDVYEDLIEFTAALLKNATQNGILRKHGLNGSRNKNMLQMRFLWAYYRKLVFICSNPWPTAKHFSNFKIEHYYCGMDDIIEHMKNDLSQEEYYKGLYADKY